MVIIWMLWVLSWEIIQMQLPVLLISFLNCWRLSPSHFRYIYLFTLVNIIVLWFRVKQQVRGLISFIWFDSMSCVAVAVSLVLDSFFCEWIPVYWTCHANQLWWLNDIVCSSSSSWSWSMVSIVASLKNIAANHVACFVYICKEGAAVEVTKHHYIHHCSSVS